MSWDKAIPWVLTAASAIVLTMIALFLVDNINWFRDTALADPAGSDLVFRMHVHHLHLATVKRAVGLFSGFSMVFLGLGVAFRQMTSQSTVGAQAPSVAVTVASASPGIVAMVLGLMLLMTTIVSKDEFPMYRSTPRESPGGEYTVPSMPDGFLDGRS